MKVTTLTLCLLAILFAFAPQIFAVTYVVTTNTDPDNTQGACATNGSLL